MAEAKTVSGLSYALYYMLLFFAHWFGSSRFDVDGNGDFDPTDVQAYLEDHHVLKRNFKGKAKAKAKGKAKANAQPTVKTEPAPGPSGNGFTEMLDRDGDGRMTMNDALESTVEGEAVEDEVYDNIFNKQRLPWFIICESLMVFGLWVVFAIKLSAERGTDPLVQKAGLDSFDGEMTDLRIARDGCEDLRPQVWRWLTYQFTHVGAMHVLMNVFLNLVLGIPLEGLHGHWRMALMFNVGVFGGACCYFVTDSHTAVVGCSGGCYALIGLHLADLVMNWKQKKFRLPVLIFIFVLVGVDVFSYVMSLSSENASHSAHIGGFIAGGIIGVMVGKNLVVKTYERVLMVIALIVGTALTIFSIAWLFAQDAGPRSIFEDNGWCWVRQVFSMSINPERWECVRCGTQSCIDEWSKQQYIEKVSRAVCVSQGFYSDER